MMEYATDELTPMAAKDSALSASGDLQKAEKEVSLTDEAQKTIGNIITEKFESCTTGE